jgi:hypothetical protein
MVVRSDEIRPSFTRVCLQSLLAIFNGSMAVCFHHARSSPARCTAPVVTPAKRNGDFVDLPKGWGHRAPPLAPRSVPIGTGGMPESPALGAEKQELLDARASSGMLGDSRPSRGQRATRPNTRDYCFAQTIVTRRVVEFGLLPQRAPFASGTKG